MLLIEANCFLLSKSNIISENRSKGQMVLKGTFQRANEVNANSRIYRKNILEREVKKLTPLIEENRLLGELDHPESEVVRLQNASHMITGLNWDGNDVIGECTLLNTPAGLTAQTLVRDGVKIGISSRGLGTLTPIGESVQEVNDDFDMRTFDLVADPSTKGAFPGLKESKNYLSEGRTIVANAKKKALSERAFVQGLKKTLGAKFDSPRNLVNEGFNGDFRREQQKISDRESQERQASDDHDFVNKELGTSHNLKKGSKIKIVSKGRNRLKPRKNPGDNLKRALNLSWKETAIEKFNSLQEMSPNKAGKVAGEVLAQADTNAQQAIRKGDTTSPAVEKNINKRAQANRIKKKFQDRGAGVGKYIASKSTSYWATKNKK